MWGFVKYRTYTVRFLYFQGWLHGTSNQRSKGPYSQITTYCNHRSKITSMCLNIIWRRRGSVRPRIVNLHDTLRPLYPRYN